MDVLVCLNIIILLFLVSFFYYLYKLNFDNLFVETLMTLHHNIGTKHGLVNEHSTYLWHKCLGSHFQRKIGKISKE